MGHGLQVIQQREDPDAAHVRDTRQLRRGLLPEMIREIFDKYLDDMERAKLIAEAIYGSWMFDDAEVLLYHALIKKTVKMIGRRQTWEYRRPW